MYCITNYLPFLPMRKKFSTCERCHCSVHRWSRLIGRRNGYTV